MGHSKTLNRFFLFALSASLISPALASLKERATSEMDYLREAAKEVELYLPNEAYVNESEAQVTPEDTEMIDEISLKKSAPVRGRSLEASEKGPELIEAPAQSETTKTGRRIRSR